jgi:hypothetical protein
MLVTVSKECVCTCSWILRFLLQVKEKTKLFCFARISKYFLFPYFPCVSFCTQLIQQSYFQISVSAASTRPHHYASLYCQLIGRMWNIPNAVFPPISAFAKLYQNLSFHDDCSAWCELNGIRCFTFPPVPLSYPILF